MILAITNVQIQSAAKIMEIGGAILILGGIIWMLLKKKKCGEGGPTAKLSLMLGKPRP